MSARDRLPEATGVIVGCMVGLIIWVLFLAAYMVLS